jgi:hypothetical protein
MEERTNRNNIQMDNFLNADLANQITILKSVLSKTEFVITSTGSGLLYDNAGTFNG